jgi:hypothetical protein
VIEMLNALTSLFTPFRHEPTDEELRQREWDHCLANALSQNERDEINDMFSGKLAA